MSSEFTQNGTPLNRQQSRPSAAARRSPLPRRRSSDQDTRGPVTDAILAAARRAHKVAIDILQHVDVKQVSWEVRRLAAIVLALVLAIVLLLRGVAPEERRRVDRRHQALLGYSTSRLERLPADLQPGSRQLSLQELLEHPLLTAHPTPKCTLSPTHRERYAPLSPSYGNGRDRRAARGRALTAHDLPRHDLTYFVALDLFDAAHVVPSLVSALERVVTLLGPERFFVSVFENGSTDDTVAQLYLFAQVLKRLGVGHRIASSARPKAFAPDTRIDGLAQLRNKALEPLLDSRKGTWDRVLFINDVHLCEADLLEMMLQHEVQGADQSCGMDYKELRIKEFKNSGYPLLFYDVWVARDMLGLPFYKIKSPSGDWDLPTGVLPLPHSPSRPRLHSLLPFQVYSCFNGVTVISAADFHPPTSLRFRAENGTDLESECFLFCRDLWKAHDPVGVDGRKPGRGARIQVVPRVSVAYDLDDYERARQDRNVTAIEAPSKRVVTEQAELIKWNKWPPKLVASYPRGHWNEGVWVPPF